MYPAKRAAATANIVPRTILGLSQKLDRIAGMASPRSSLIISDEELSTETGKNTEFVVVLNDEPQGGIKKRRAAGVARPRDRLTY